VDQSRENVGPDRVRFSGDNLVVEAACEMPDWKATRYRRTAIVFRQRTYFVASSASQASGVHRYVLEPWPEDLHDEPGRIIDYHAAYALERDERRRRQARVERESLVLFFLSPLLGFLPSGLKLALNDRYGYDPVTVTGRSLFIQRLLMLMLMALAPLSLFAGIPIAPVAGLLLMVLVDLVIRQGRQLRGTMRQYGFWEWAVRRIRDE
jgi:hypothetical protein